MQAFILHLVFIESNHFVSIDPGIHVIDHSSLFVCTSTLCFARGWIKNFYLNYCYIILSNYQPDFMARWQPQILRSQCPLLIFGWSFSTYRIRQMSCYACEVHLSRIWFTLGCDSGNVRGSGEWSHAHLELLEQQRLQEHTMHVLNKLHSFRPRKISMQIRALRI